MLSVRMTRIQNTIIPMGVDYMIQIVVDVKNTIGIEQGNILTTGTDTDPTRIHSVGFIPLEYTDSPPSDLTISAATSTSKTLELRYVIYSTARYTDISYNPPAWLSNPCAVDLSEKTNINYIATYARYSDNSNIAPSDITSWTITYETESPPDESLPTIGQGFATEVTDTTSLPYKRFNNSGYTNPDLIRFQDEDFVEGTTQKVGVFGVNSYRYIETDDYEDGSTTCEIP